VLDDVLAADWSPDGKDLAVLHRVDGEWQLEYPIGRVVWRLAPFFVDLVRVCPDGSQVAVADAGHITLVDRRGRRKRLVAPYPHYSAWTPRGDALLVASGEAMQYRSLRRLGLDGTLREFYALPGTLVVHDVAQDGRVLIHHGFERVGTRGARAPGETTEHEVGAYAASRPVSLSANGEQLLLVDYGEPGVVSLLRPTRGGPEVRLAAGEARGLSDDGRWVLRDG
jgi:hypothetical protein